MGSSAFASRKRVVVLPFEGEKAEKFHDSVVKLIKKTHTVLSSAKWASTAEGLSADSGSEKDIKKVAKKLKIDGVVEGKIEKRRNEYIIRLKLHAGTTGAMSKSVNTKAENIKLEGDAESDIKDELVSAIGELETNRTSNDDLDEDSSGEDEKPPTKDDKKKKKFDKKAASSSEDDEDEAKPTKDEKKKKAAAAASEDGEDEAKPTKDDKKDKKSAFSKKKGGDEDTEALKTKKDKDKDKETKDSEDENPLPDPPKKAKKVAKKDKDEGESDDGVSEKSDVTKKTGAEARVPGERAIDMVAGLSLTTRRLTWKTDADLVQKPPDYKGLPAPTGMFDLTFYPMAFSHKNEGLSKDIGVSLAYDKALLISSKDQNGNKLETAYSRFAIGGAYRHQMGASVIGGTLRYGRQDFVIQNSEMIGIPNVNYSYLSPGGFFRYPFNPKITLNFDLAALLVLKTGQMQQMQNYGGASVLGFEGEVGGDYALTGSIFVRAGLQVESIGYSFNGKGALTNADADPEQDVQGARDTYIGVVGTIGYIY